MRLIDYITARSNEGEKIEKADGYDILMGEDEEAGDENEP